MAMKEKRMNKKYYNVEEIADYLNVSVSAIRKWVRLHEIPTERIRGCLRFNIDKIDRWVKEQSRTCANT